MFVLIATERQYYWGRSLTVKNYQNNVGKLQVRVKKINLSELRKPEWIKGIFGAFLDVIELMILIVGALIDTGSCPCDVKKN